LSTSRTGALIERRAARHYRLRGYRVLGTNVWAGGYELDLIVRRGRRVVFCEVKGKTGAGYGDPLEMVDEEKLRRLRRAAETWLARNPAGAGLDHRFEVVAVRPGGLERRTV
jgi:putative endonuclease